MKRAALTALVAVLLLAGCTPAAPADPDAAFRTGVTADGIDPALVPQAENLAHAVCGALDEVDADMTIAVARDTAARDGLPVSYVNAVIRHGVPAYCPQHADDVEAEL